MIRLPSSGIRCIEVPDDDTLGMDNLLNLIKRIVLINWLWQVFAGFYLVTYTFWIPVLFNSILTQMLIASLNLVIGMSLLIEGFSRALELEYAIVAPDLPFRRVREALGAVLLFGYLLIYALPRGRLVPYWPLNMVITFLTGAIMLAYAIWNVDDKGDV
jgi:hypothetical protein